MSEHIRLSVRELVESVMKQGSIESASLIGSNRAVLGTIAHKKVQQMMDSHYEKEVPLKFEVAYKDLAYVIEGRADGIIQDLIGITIDEIKSTRTALERIEEDYNELHWAQAKCYGYIYAKQQGIPKLSVRLTYYHLISKKIKHFVRLYTVEELEAFFYDLLEKYSYWVKWQLEWEHMRNQKLKAYNFPFETYRTGQRELAVTIYKSILDNQKLYVNAPTGTGKTISTLFPTVKAMGEGHVKKIFYLTAKTITRTVAQETLQMMYDGGAKLKVITLTAKDKICPLEERNCTPKSCHFADGHFNRIEQAIKDGLANCDLFTRDEIMHYATKHQVCPFEYALDIAIYADIVICDYNHVFDPTASLKRFHDDKAYVYLVDEAHNLVDRARSMFSATVDRMMVIQAKKSVGKEHQRIGQTLKKIDDYLKQIQKVAEQTQVDYVAKDRPTELKMLVKDYIEATDERLGEGKGDFASDFIDFYFEAQHFLKIYEVFDERYVQFVEGRGKYTRLKLYCIDPSFLISELLSTCKSAIFFSATLMPMPYYQYMLGGEDSRAVFLDSVFSQEQSALLLATDVSTKYQHREASYDKIVQYIDELTSPKVGNYLIFFPSYQYMLKIYERYQENKTGTNCILQQPHMAEEEREQFLMHFQEGTKETTIGFCVLGGLFSEGIDLRGERLIGVGVVGVGLPQIGLERDLIKHYFDDRGQDGYHYAYTYPGMNKVLQAIGRLIRTEQDTGVVLLIDDRYHTSFYKALLPHYLKHYQEVNSQTVRNEIIEFIEK